MKEMQIKKINASEAFDSRGNPTVEATVILEDGSMGISLVPSGASTGSFEALELRDGDYSEFNGLGVTKAVDNVNKKIAKALIGENAFNQQAIDEKMIDLDGTENKSKLGANAILGVSMAIAKAASNSLKLPLYRYIGGIADKNMPQPMMNILNGGRHSSNNLNIQEFMIVPIKENSFKENMQMCIEIYQVLKEILKQKGLSTSVGDEGGFAPDLESDEEAIKLIMDAIDMAGLSTKKDVKITLDIASSEMKQSAKKIEKEGYYFWKSDEYKTKKEMIDYIINLTEKYPIISVEDGLDEEDFSSWKELTNKIGKKVDLVGDDLFVTNKERLKKGIKEGVANAILIKPNQIGTLTETLDTINLAVSNGYKTIISHRSGETEDTFIADLAVATKASRIKMGAPCRSERVAKYNRLLRIERELIF